MVALSFSVTVERWSTYLLKYNGMIFLEGMANSVQSLTSAERCRIKDREFENAVFLMEGVRFYYRSWWLEGSFLH